MFWSYLAVNVFLVFLTWASYRRLLAGRGKDFHGSFQQITDFFLYWIFVSTCFMFVFFYRHDPLIVLLNIFEVLIFIALVKIGTRDMDHHDH